FSLAQDFDNSSNPGFLVEDCRVRVRLNNQSWVLNIDSEGQFNNVPGNLPQGSLGCCCYQSLAPG
ncbi:hypothetical protein ACUOFC_05720, partial [Escherichia sp. TWPC-MK]